MAAIVVIMDAEVLRNRKGTAVYIKRRKTPPQRLPRIVKTRGSLTITFCIMILPSVAQSATQAPRLIRSIKKAPPLNNLLSYRRSTEAYPFSSRAAGHRPTIRKTMQMCNITCRTTRDPFTCKRPRGNGKADVETSNIVRTNNDCHAYS